MKPDDVVIYVGPQDGILRHYGNSWDDRLRESRPLVVKSIVGGKYPIANLYDPEDKETCQSFVEWLRPLDNL